MTQKDSTNQEAILQILQGRFHLHKKRHPTIEWEDVQKKLLLEPQKLNSLMLMEQTGGEPDVLAFEIETGTYVFYDCSIETPKGRRSLCYDQEAHETRKTFKPASSAVYEATAMGAELLNEEQYRYLQTVVACDMKTSSWIRTPESIRGLGGALFCDRRYNMVFTYHNGAESYYSSRGFRTMLRV